MDEACIGLLDKRVAWFLIEVDFSNGLPATLDIFWETFSIKQHVDNWSVPFRCIGCHEVGHLISRCIRRLGGVLPGRKNSSIWMNRNPSFAHGHWVNSQTQSNLDILALEDAPFEYGSLSEVENTAPNPTLNPAQKNNELESYPHNFRVWDGNDAPINPSCSTPSYLVVGSNRKLGAAGVNVRDCPCLSSFAA